jgi:hypothetical protein
MGGIWTYDKLAELAEHTVGPVASEQRVAVDRLHKASVRSATAAGEEARALDELTLAREAYRTALDAGELAEVLRLEYEAAERAYARAQAETRAARAAVAAAQPAARVAQEQLGEERARAANREALLTFALRFVLVAMLLGLGF